MRERFIIFMLFTTNREPRERRETVLLIVPHAYLLRMSVAMPFMANPALGT